MRISYKVFIMNVIEILKKYKREIWQSEFYDKVSLEDLIIKIRKASETISDINEHHKNTFGLWLSKSIEGLNLNDRRISESKWKETFEELKKNSSEDLQKVIDNLETR